MSGRIAANLGKILTSTAVVTFGADQIANRRGESTEAPSASPPQLPPPRSPRSGTGNDQLLRRAESIRPDANANPALEGLRRKPGQMTRPFENLLKVAREAHQLGMADFRRMHEELKDQAHVAVGSAKVLGGTEEVTLSDMGRLGKAAAKDALDSIDLSKPVESIRKIADTAYAVSTSTTEGVDAITGALRESLKFEGKAALAGSVAVTGICRGLLMSGVPPLQAAGLVLGVLNMAGSATQVSEALRKFGGGDSTSDSALLQEVHQILAEKGSK